MYILLYPTVSLEYIGIHVSQDTSGYRNICVSSLEQVADRWSRGGKVAYKGEAKCDWRRRMSNDGKQIVRLIQYKGKIQDNPPKSSHAWS